jgi:hypothetical protein
MTEKMELTLSEDAELAAMATVFNALRALDAEAQNRVLEYVERRLGVQRVGGETKRIVQGERYASELLQAANHDHESGSSATAARDDQETDEGDIEGISPIARKWMTRNGLTPMQVSSLFSLGVDEIDLVAANVPGKSTRDRLHNVILLQGVASYLNSGAPRVENEKLKEAMRHYDADPGGNFSAYMKDWASEFSGSRSAGGFTLTTRGLNSAKELLKQMTGDSGNE